MVLSAPNLIRRDQLEPTREPRTSSGQMPKPVMDKLRAALVLRIAEAVASAVQVEAGINEDVEEVVDQHEVRMDVGEDPEELPSVTVKTRFAHGSKRKGDEKENSKAKKEKPDLVSAPGKVSRDRSFSSSGLSNQVQILKV